MNSEISTPAFSFAAPDKLKVNLLSCAHGIPKTAPSFSWVMRSNDVDDIQTGYRILIASRLADMQEGDVLLDTGWTATDESGDITIAGLDTILQDNELYYWAVQLRNKHGAESVLSEPMPFTTAVGNQWEDTHSIWSPDENGAGDFCFLRTEFKISDKESIERAVIHVTATSPEPSRQYVYHLFLNGNFVGLGPTRIGKNENNEELLYYNSYDVTEALQSGNNALGVINYTTEEKGFLCQLTVFYKNGTKRVVLNSARDAESFMGLDGAKVFASGNSIGTKFYFAEAENINATTYPFGFDRPGFDAPWQPVHLRDDLEVENERHLAPYPGEPIGRFTHDIASVERAEDGHYIIDLGHEIVGGLRLTLSSPSVHTIRLYFGEERNEDGSVRFHMRTGNVYRESWTLREGEQTLENFSLKAFRYVDIYDCLAELTEENIHGIAIRRAFDADESSFTCSNEVLCRLYDTAKYAICATNQDIYLDSQTRERTTNARDTLINMLACYTYQSSMSLARFSIDFLLSHAAKDQESALLLIHTVRLDYLYSGNRTLLTHAYPTLRKLIMSDSADESTGLFARPSDTCDGQPSEEDAPLSTTYNAIRYIVLRDLAVMASVLGKEDDATQIRTMADALRHQMIALLYVPEMGAFRCGLGTNGVPVDRFPQRATAYALCAGIYNEDTMKDTLGRTLIGQDNIQVDISDAFFLLDALYRAGFGTYATALLASNDQTPGAHTFAAALSSSGATIAPEAWSTDEKPDMAFSSPRGTCPAALIARNMFGIRPTRPGFHKFEIRPQIGDLPYVSIRVPTVKGTIGVSLGQNIEAYEAEVIVPPNTKATVFLPVLPGGTDTLFVNNQKSNFPIEGSCFHIELGSGTHRLLAQ